MIEEDILIAVIAGLLNLLLSILIPPLINKTDIPFTNEIKNHYECNKNYILVSTILTSILVYISLKVTPYVQSSIFGNLSKLNTTNTPPTNTSPTNNFVSTNTSPTNNLSDTSLTPVYPLIK